MKTMLCAFVVFFTSITILTSCKKDNPAPINHPPVADAGSSQTIQLPLDSVMLTGSGRSADTKIVGYLWSEITGPNVPVIASQSSTSTEIRGLVVGTYSFQFMVIDSLGLTGVDTVSVTVNPSLLTTVTLQPVNNPTEAFAFSVDPTGFTGNPNQLAIFAWTINSQPVFGRDYIKFDYSQIPTNATITSAKLSLYSMPVSLLGNFIDPQFGPANACNIRRVTSSWTDSTLTWNNQPTTTTSNQSVIPQSTSSFEDETDLDVTALVKDMQTNGNNGFALSLQNEATFNIRQFASSFYTDATRHPKLVIIFNAQ